MRNRFVGMICLILVCLFVIPCLVMAEGKTQISFMLFYEGGQSTIASTVFKLTEEFNANNPYNVEIVIETIASEQSKTKLPTLMAANAAPDIFNCWAAGYLQPYVDAGKIYCLDEAFAADPDWKASFKDGVFDSLTYDGKIHGVPSQLELWGLYYNKTIFERCGVALPNNWRELIAALEMIKEKEPDTIPMAYGNKDAWPIASLCEGLSNRLGGQEKFLQATAGEIPWSDESFVKAAELIKEMADKGLFPEGVNGLPASEEFVQFSSGRAAVLSHLMSYFDVFTEDAVITPEEVEFRNIPMVVDGDGDPNWWLGQVGYNLAISETCPNKEAAVAYVKLITGVEMQQAIMESSAIPVYRSDLLNTENAAPIIKTLMSEADQMSGMFVFYDVVLGPVLGNEYNSTIQSVVGGADPHEALEGFNQFYLDNVEF